MVLAAEEAGIPAGATLLDATSGNTGVALALVGAVRGHPVELCMPDRVSLERKRIARAYGATLTLTDASWVADTGRLHQFMREGRAAQTEFEPVGVVGVQWVAWLPWDHALPTEASGCSRADRPGERG